MKFADGISVQRSIFDRRGKSLSAHAQTLKWERQLMDDHYVPMHTARSIRDFSLLNTNVDCDVSSQANIFARNAVLPV